MCMYKSQPNETNEFMLWYTCTGCAKKKVRHEKTILFFLNMKITQFEITMNIIMWSNLLCVSGFVPVNFGASVNKL